VVEFAQAHLQVARLAARLVDRMLVVVSDGLVEQHLTLGGAQRHDGTPAEVAETEEAHLDDVDRGGATTGAAGSRRRRRRRRRWRRRFAVGQQSLAQVQVYGAETFLFEANRSKNRVCFATARVSRSKGADLEVVVVVELVEVERAAAPDKRQPMGDGRVDLDMAPVRRPTGGVGVVRRRRADRLGVAVQILVLVVHFSAK